MHEYLISQCSAYEPTLNGSSALQRNATEIRNRIMLNFYLGLPHMYTVTQLAL